MLYRIFVTILILLIQSLASAQSQSDRFVSIYHTEGNVLMSLGGTGPLLSTGASIAVTPGSRMETWDPAWAEVRLEDGSMIRVAPSSELFFDEVGTSPQGQRVTAIHLTSGEAEFRIKGHSGDLFEVRAGNKVIRPAGTSKFRVSIPPSLTMKIMVNKGTVAVYGATDSPEARLTAKYTLLQKPDLNTFTVVKGAPRDELDRWSRKRDRQIIDNWLAEAPDLRDHCQKDPNACTGVNAYPRVERDAGSLSSNYERGYQRPR